MVEKYKKLWIEALLSGDYEQGHHSLCENDKYCCLGILCAIHEGVTLKYKKGGHRKVACFKKDKCAAFLPKSLRKALKITEKQEEKLVCLNDSGNKSFKQIATYIQRYI